MRPCVTARKCFGFAPLRQSQSRLFHRPLLISTPRALVRVGLAYMCMCLCLSVDSVYLSVRVSRDPRDGTACPSFVLWTLVRSTTKGMPVATGATGEAAAPVRSYTHPPHCVAHPTWLVHFLASTRHEGFNVTTEVGGGPCRQPGQPWAMGWGPDQSERRAEERKPLRPFEQEGEQSHPRLYSERGDVEDQKRERRETHVFNARAPCGMRTSVATLCFSQPLQPLDAFHVCRHERQTPSILGTLGGVRPYAQLQRRGVERNRSRLRQ